MPDLINPDQREGRKEFAIWADEICKACKNQKSCPLMAVLAEYEIMTFMGIRVSNCRSYNPDTESRYYLPEDAGMEQIKNINLDVLEQQIDLLQKALGATDVVSGSS